MRRPARPARPARPIRRSALRPGAIAAIAAIAAILLAACTGGSAPAPTPSAPAASPVPAGSPSPAGSPAAWSDLVLRATFEGGLIAPGARRGALPLVSVYADGRIVTAGTVPAIYPGPLVAPLVVRSIGPDGAAGVLEAAGAGGLTSQDAIYPGGPVADAPQTVLTVVHDGVRTVSRFNALGAGPSPDPSSSDPANRARVAAGTILDGLTGSATFGGTDGGSGVYVPEGYRLYVTPGAPEASDPSLARPAADWPLSTPLASFGEADPQGGDGARVGVVVGDDAQTLAPVIAEATRITPFRSGGRPWTLVVRPLLPDEAVAPGG